MRKDMCEAGLPTSRKRVAWLPSPYCPGSSGDRAPTGRASGDVFCRHLSNELAPTFRSLWPSLSWST
jgi:hypothetical protein